MSDTTAPGSTTVSTTVSTRRKSRPASIEDLAAMLRSSPVLLSFLTKKELRQLLALVRKASGRVPRGSRVRCGSLLDDIGEALRSPYPERGRPARP